MDDLIKGELPLGTLSLLFLAPPSQHCFNTVLQVHTVSLLPSKRQVPHGDSLEYQIFIKQLEIIRVDRYRDKKTYIIFDLGKPADSVDYDEMGFVRDGFFSFQIELLGRLENQSQV